MKNGSNSRKLKLGDIVEVEWYDTHGIEKLTIEEIINLDDPCTTIAFGIVLRNGTRYLTIASEISSDLSTDGNYLEQIPHGTIEGIRVFGKRKLESCFVNDLNSNDV